MLQLAEVLAAQAKQRRAVEFRVATDVVVRVWMELLPFPVPPLFFCVVFPFDVDGPAVPVVLFPVHVVAALDQKNTLARGRELSCEGPATCARPDDNHVVLPIRRHLCIS